ncbi:hypothetical protein TNCV_3148082 [Trichonephila clavipes]|nr:hypothetical protein TNCV_3148082 [Trichonephila clavipes]
MNALPDSFLSATNPVSCNRYTESVIIDAFGAVSPGYSPEMHLSHDRVTEREHNQWRNGEHLRPLQSQVSGFQVGICKRVGTWWQSGFVPPRTRSPRSVGVEGVTNITRRRSFWRDRLRPAFSFERKVPRKSLPSLVTLVEQRTAPFMHRCCGAIYPPQQQPNRQTLTQYKPLLLEVVKQ